MTYRPFFIYGDDATPPETDPAPVECSACGETECDCGDCGAASPQAAEEAATARMSATSGVGIATPNPASPCFDAATSRDAAGMETEQ